MLYTNDKSHRITLRLNDRQFDFVRQSADAFAVSPSEYLRMLVATSMAASSAVSNPNNNGGLRRENEQVDSHYIV